MTDVWKEPARAIPLRWGSYRLRYVAAIILILGGALLVQPTSVYSGYLFEIGVPAQILGWFIIPSRGSRRAWAALPSALCSCALLIGSAGTFALVVPLVAWLVIRQRSALSYVVLLLPLMNAIVLLNLFPQYGDGTIVVVVSFVVIVGSAWLARAIAISRPQRLDQPND